LFAPLIFLAELRSLYVGVPIVFVFTVVAAWPRLESWARRGILVTVAMIVLAFGIVVAVAPQGRLERFSPAFFLSHVATLVGEEGPGAGSLRQRIDWLGSAIERLNERPVRWLVGVGVGPDLADGFVDLNARPVRKPHNDFLEVMTRFGLPALLLFLGVILVPLGAAFLAARTHLGDAATRFMWWLIATVLIYLIVAVTQPLLSYPYATVPVYTLLGIGFALAQRGEPERTGREGAEDPDRRIAEAEPIE
jgi:O-antigen ligase